MRLLLHIAISLAFSACCTGVFAQCSENNTYDGDLTPTGVGDTQTESCATAGDYYVVTVCDGADYTFSTCGSSWDTRLTLYYDTGTFIDDNDDSCGNQSEITWTSDYDGDVHILLDRHNCNHNNNCATLAVTMDTDCGTAGPPANDECAGAITVTCGSSTDGTTEYAAIDTSGDCGVSITSPGVWYTFAGTDQWVTFSVCDNTSYDSKISVYSGSCGTFQCAGGNDDFSGCSGYSSELSLYCHSGLTYYILIHGYGGESGTFTLDVTCATASADPEDCTGGVTICDDNTFGGNASDYGSYQELNSTNNDCLSVEHQSSWFFFSPTTEGTIEFTLTPTNGIDYDFAIWGPYDDINCPPFEDPIRCSYSDDYAPTGLLDGAGDNSEGWAGDAWVEAIIVTADDVDKHYIMLLDNWTADNTSYSFAWDLTDVILNCSIALPVEFLYFEGEVKDERNELRWATATEHNNDFFEVQRSTDNINWEVINIIEGMGDSFEQVNYLTNDTSRPTGTTYYRLRQVDFDGQYEYSETISLVNHAIVDLLSLYPNPTRSQINMTMNSIEEMNVQVGVYDLAGRQVMQHNVQLSKGVNIFSFNLDGLNQGLFTLRVSDMENRELITEKVFKK